MQNHTYYEQTEPALQTFYPPWLSTINTLLWYCICVISGGAIGALTIIAERDGLLRLLYYPALMHNVDMFQVSSRVFPFVFMFSAPLILVLKRRSRITLSDVGINFCGIRPNEVMWEDISILKIKRYARSSAGNIGVRTIGGMRYWDGVNDIERFVETSRRLAPSSLKISEITLGTRYGTNTFVLSVVALCVSLMAVVVQAVLLGR